MSLFGEVQTPRAERPGPPVKPLTELSLRVYGARLEPEQNVVRLHAEAKMAFADGMTGASVSVGFFLNGRRLSDIVSDDYGLALFDEAVPADRFCDGENELVVRVRGFAREASQKFEVQRPKPVLPPPPKALAEESQVVAIVLEIQKSVIDQRTESYILHATAKMFWATSAVVSGVPVSFFLNGERCTDVLTDSFGIANLRAEFPSTRSQAVRNDVVVRVEGCSIEDRKAASVATRGVHIRQLNWKWNPHRPIRMYARLQGEMRLIVNASPTGDNYPLEGMELRLRRGDTPLASGTFDVKNTCEIRVPEFYVAREGSDWDHVRFALADWRICITGVIEVSMIYFARSNEGVIEPER